MSKPNWRFVRLKPYDKARGHVLKNYWVSGQHFTQDPGKAWKQYDVSNPNNAQLVEYLATCTQEVNSPVPAFDIVDEVGLAYLRQQEKLAKMGARPSVAAPAQLQPPEVAVATPTSVNDPEPTHAVDLAASMPVLVQPPATLPPSVVEEENSWAESKAAAEEERAETAKPKSKRPKRTPAAKKKQTKRAPAAKKR